MKIIIKLILIGLLIGALQTMPYSYYEVSRVVIMIGFVYLAYIEYEVRRIPLVALYAVGAILFNPFINFAFRRPAWQIIDKWCIGILIGLLIIDAIKAIQNTRVK